LRKRLKEGMPSKPKPTRSIRMEQELLDKVKDLGLDLTEICEAAVAKAVGDLKCPYCGQRMKPKK
jgi:post-segregation antitoxin (ccd killing protein)